MQEPAGGGADGAPAFVPPAPPGPVLVAAPALTALRTPPVTSYSTTMNTISRATRNVFNCMPCDLWIVTA